MNAFEALPDDEQSLFYAEHLELFKAAMALNDAITGASPVPLTHYAAETNPSIEDVRVGDTFEVGAKLTRPESAGSDTLKFISFDGKKSYNHSFRGSYTFAAEAFGVPTKTKWTLEEKNTFTKEYTFRGENLIQDVTISFHHHARQGLSNRGCAGKRQEHWRKELLCLYQCPL